MKQGECWEPNFSKVLSQESEMYREGRERTEKLGRPILMLIVHCIIWLLSPSSLPSVIHFVMNGFSLTLKLGKSEVAHKDLDLYPLVLERPFLWLTLELWEDPLGPRPLSWSSFSSGSQLPSERCSPAFGFFFEFP